MKKVKALIFNSWTLIILCLLAIGFVIYFVGPLIAIADWKPLESALNRWLLILFVILIWGAIKAFSIIKAKNEESGFLKDLFTKNKDDANQVDSSQELSQNERSTLDVKFKEAVASLKKSSKTIGRKFNLYEVPWYIIIGPPGSGKTTALLNSGLKFPLSKEFGTGSIKGIGGTRNCDWWFTNKGVIIDTAGRYTTQDSHKDVDSAAWQNFLALLKKFRKRRPINGVFLTISAQELLLQTPDQRAQHIAAISNRLQELKEAFKIDFPVYLLITKTDLIAGFEEYFDNFGKTDREQVWGATFPFEAGESKNQALTLFSSEFDQLLMLLNERLINRLHQERDQQRAQKIASFPKQLQYFKPVLEQFIKDVFENSRFSQQILLRGFYFCSGTQEGTPIDRLMNKLGGTAPAISSKSKGKSFFIKNLFEHIVFPESELAGTDVKLEKRLQLINIAAIAGVGVFSLALIGGWTASYLNNQSLIDQSRSALEAAESEVEKLSPYDLQPGATLPLLNTLRDLPGGYAYADESIPFLTGLGLNQSKKIGEQSSIAYQRVLNKALLSRLMIHTENKIGAPGVDQGYAYAALRTYLMLGSDEHFRGNEVNAFYQYDWLHSIARELTNEQNEAFLSHLEALFAFRPSPLPMPLDNELVNRTQLQLSSTPLEATVFGRLEQLDFDNLEPFTIYAKAGRELADKAFIRKSGKSLSEGLRPLYSKKAYYLLMNQDIEILTDEVIEESWVYGENYTENRQIDRTDLINKVKAIYTERYIEEYKDLLNDIDIVPFSNYTDAASVLNTISATNSPLQQLLQAIKNETQFGAGQLTDKLKDSNALFKAQSKLKRILGESSDDVGKSFNQPTDPITTRFYPLHQLVTAPEGSQALPLKQTLDQLAELYRFMAKVSIESSGKALDPAVAKTGQASILKTRLTAENQPKMLVKPLIRSIAQRTAGLAFGGVIAHINQQWAQEPREFCMKAVEGRYPFDKRSRSDITLNDFGSFFGYDGILDKFFKQHLKDFVDTSTSPWQVHSKHKDLISLSAEALTAFEQAHLIRKSFFNNGGKNPVSNNKMTPTNLDDGLRGFYLSVDGQSIQYEFGPLLAEQMQWPGPNPGSGASLTLRQVNGGDISIYEEGDWAWFRLLDKVIVRRSNSPERFNINFRASGYSANYNLIAGGAYNPYRLGSRLQFKCPNTI